MADPYARQGMKPVTSTLGGLFAASASPGADDDGSLAYTRVAQGGGAAKVRARARACTHMRARCAAARSAAQRGDASSLASPLPRRSRRPPAAAAAALALAPRLLPRPSSSL